MTYVLLQISFILPLRTVFELRHKSWILKLTIFSKSISFSSNFGYKYSLVLKSYYEANRKTNSNKYKKGENGVSD